MKTEDILEDGETWEAGFVDHRAGTGEWANCKACGKPVFCSRTMPMSPGMRIRCQFCRELAFECAKFAVRRRRVPCDPPVQATEGGFRVGDLVVPVRVPMAVPTDPSAPLVPDHLVVVSPDPFILSSLSGHMFFTKATVKPEDFSVLCQAHPDVTNNVLLKWENTTCLPKQFEPEGPPPPDPIAKGASAGGDEAKECLREAMILIREAMSLLPHRLGKKIVPDRLWERWRRAAYLIPKKESL